MPISGKNNEFEAAYLHDLHGLFIGAGLPILYARDLAALDGGLHLYEASAGEDKSVSQTRIWYQAKGLRRDTLTQNEFEQSTTIPVEVRSDHLRYWFAHPEPVYLIVYVQAVGRFLAEDIRDVVARRWPRTTIYQALPKNQDEVTVRVSTQSVLDRDMVAGWLRHRSIRLDGPAFRGRPLGHRLDPLRSEMEPPEPKLFSLIVDRLLEVHNFRRLSGAESPKSTGTLSSLRAMKGCLFQTLEWQDPLGTAFGVQDKTEFRIEAELESVHGELLVIEVPVQGGIKLDASDEYALISWIIEQKVCQVLVIFNAPSLAFESVGTWNRLLRATRQKDGNIRMWLMNLGGLSLNMLVATLLYLEFAPRLRWATVNYLG
jgi:hypothetical protein